MLPSRDDDSLICGYRFRPGQPAEPIGTLAQAQALLQEPGLPDGFVWLHMNLSHAATLRWLRRHTDLGEAYFEALADGSRSDALFAVLNDVTFDSTVDTQEVETLWLSVAPRRVISVRRRPLRSVDRLRTEVRRGQPVDNSVDLLDHLLRDQADELQRTLRRTAERLDEIEDDVLAGRHRQHAAELARQRRLTVRLQRLLTPEPGSLARVLTRPPGWMQPADVQQLAQANDEFALVLRDIAALQDRIRLMQDESAARTAEDTNRSLFLLTMVTVLALPINLVSGLFGMNVGGMPLAEDDTGFWLMLGLIASLTGLIGWVLVRRLGPGRD
jgi:zinc transporter